jgi:hypothetical protein
VSFASSGFAYKNCTFALLVRVALDVIDDGLKSFVLGMVNLFKVEVILKRRVYAATAKGVGSIPQAFVHSKAFSQFQIEMVSKGGIVACIMSAVGVEKPVVNLEEEMLAEISERVSR